jgi:hypothetical protein
MHCCCEQCCAASATAGTATAGTSAAVTTAAELLLLLLPLLLWFLILLLLLMLLLLQQLMSSQVDHLQQNGLAGSYGPIPAGCLIAALCDLLSFYSPNIVSVVQAIPACRHWFFLFLMLNSPTGSLDEGWGG